MNVINKLEEHCLLETVSFVERISVEYAAKLKELVFVKFQLEWDFFEIEKDKYKIGIVVYIEEDTSKLDKEKICFYTEKCVLGFQSCVEKFNSVEDMNILQNIILDIRFLGDIYE